MHSRICSAFLLWAFKYFPKDNGVAHLATLEKSVHLDYEMTERGRIDVNET